MCPCLGALTSRRGARERHGRHVHRHMRLRRKEMEMDSGRGHGQDGLWAGVVGDGPFMSFQPEAKGMNNGKDMPCSGA